MRIVDEIVGLFDRHGDSEYGGEHVTQREHALQAALLAEQQGADANLVSAALLHDVGHLLHDLPDDAPDQGVDDFHEEKADCYLRSHFPESVTEPVRLHVAAKRYLCAVDDHYMEQLSPPSQLSLKLQGGPMSSDEVAEFESNPFFEDAVKLRKWDDEAKIPGLETPDVRHYADALRNALTMARGS